MVLEVSSVLIVPCAMRAILPVSYPWPRCLRFYQGNFLNQGVQRDENENLWLHLCGGNVGLSRRGQFLVSYGSRAEPEHHAVSVCGEFSAHYLQPECFRASQLLLRLRRAVRLDQRSTLCFNDWSYRSHGPPRADRCNRRYRSPRASRRRRIHSYFLYLLGFHAK